jgi:2-aminoadipate transaminase
VASNVYDLASARRPRVARRLEGVTSSVVRDLLALTQRPGLISFAGGLPAPELFDTEGLRAAFARATAEHDPRRAWQYSPTEGNARLRTLVAERLTTRGLPTEADDLLITTGSQQALALATTALVDPGAVVAVEDPTYLAALQAFQLCGARIVGVRSDDDGLDPESLAEVIAEHHPSLLYLVPTFANPTGRTLSAERRVRIAELAAEHGLWVVEDDPYGDLRYEGDPLAPLAAQPAVGDHAIYLGSFSKIGAPGLRIGWLRAPRLARPPIVVVKQASDLHTSTVDQAAVAHYLEHADLDGHVKRLCFEYGLRRDALLASLGRHFPSEATWNHPEGGMFAWLRLPDGFDSGAYLSEALDVGVAFVPGAAFYSGPPDPATMRLTFVTHQPDEIEEGVRRLAAVFS